MQILIIYFIDLKFSIYKETSPHFGQTATLGFSTVVPKTPLVVILIPYPCISTLTSKFSTISS